jgi:glycosyltransferase involved in cell wall biosynthesis
VTVIMATYNWAPVLPYSIASVLDQTYRDFELWVIGDGCTDESAEVVTGIGDPRVHWHNLEHNHGHQSAPNNEGLARARSPLVAYLGHDDLWLPHHLATLVAAFDDPDPPGSREADRHPPDGAPGTAMAHATTLLVKPQTRPELWPEPGWRYQTGGSIPPTTTVHDRDLALSVGGWKPPSTTSALDPDADLWMRMAATSVPVHVDAVTSVKLSAAHRRRVYGDRPHHEQAWWLERMRAAADPEADVRAAAGQPYRWSTDEPAADAWQSRAERLGWTVRTRWRRLRGRAPVTSAERFALRRRYKGIDRS